MTALEKLRSAFASQIIRNVDPHGELVLVGVSPQDGMKLEVVPEYEHEQEPDDDAQPEYLTLFDVTCAFDEIAELEQRKPLDREAEDVETDPGKRYMQILAEWKDDRTKLAYYKEQEKEKRLVLFAGAFPNPVEGSQKFKLADGRTLKAQYKINRKIDEAALPTTLAHMRELGVANTDALVRYKPELAKREWNTLSDENKLSFSPAVIATPGTPTLDIELPKALS